MILVGHGAASRDTPRDLVSRLKALEGRRRATGAAMSDEERDLDAKVREWPRTDATDPYRAGLESLALALEPLLGDCKVVLAYNEFCAPTVEQAFAEVVALGATRVVVLTSMLTPGGVHAEVEIPEALSALRAAHPEIDLRYAWPYDTGRVAALFADQIGLATPSRT